MEKTEKPSCAADVLDTAVKESLKKPNSQAETKEPVFVEE